MAISFNDFEIPLLQALIKLGGSAEVSDVYPVVESIKVVELSDSVLKVTW